MPKSLGMSSEGLDFDTFMKALVKTPTKPKPKKKAKKKPAKR